MLTSCQRCDHASVRDLGEFSDHLGDLSDHLGDLSDHLGELFDHLGDLSDHLTSRYTTPSPYMPRELVTV